VQLLENVRLGWGKGHILCGLLAIGFVFGASAQSQNRQLETLIEDGQRDLDAGDFGGAVASFERATQMAPDNLEANRGLLLSYLQAKRLRDAENAGQSAIVRWPKDAQLQHWLGLVYFKEGQNAKALEQLRSAERLVSAGQAFVGAAKAAYLPQISIGGAAGYVGNSFDAMGSSNTPRYAIGPVISWPALNLGRVKADVDVARAQEAESEAYYHKTQLQAYEEIATSVVAYNKARRSLDFLEAAARASERAAGLARLRFDEGATDFLQVLDAERTMLEAQDRLAGGRTAATTRLVTLYRALGGALP